MPSVFLDFDYQLFRFFNDLAGKSAVWDFVFVFLAEYFMFLMIGGLAVFILIRKGESFRSLLAFKSLAAAFLGRAVIVLLIRTFFFRPRPFVAGIATQLVPHNPLEGSFPSGHATVMFALAFSLLLRNRMWGLFYLSLALLSSLARIIVGVHFPFDIFGGIFIAAISVFITEQLFDFWLKKKKKEVQARQ